jgi:hypothetical protein
MKPSSVSGLVLVGTSSRVGKGAAKGYIKAAEESDAKGLGGLAAVQRAMVIDVLQLA